MTVISSTWIIVDGLVMRPGDRAPQKRGPKPKPYTGLGLTDAHAEIAVRIAARAAARGRR